MNQVTTTNENKAVTNYAAQSSAGILASDVIIPRLLLMQGPSDFVKERKAQMGDIVRSTDAAKLGDPETSVEIIPLSIPVATWIEERKPHGSNRFVYTRMTPRTAKNDTEEWQYFVDENGNEVPEGTKGAIPGKRTKCLSLYVLLPQDLEAFAIEKEKAARGEDIDMSKSISPLLVAFRSTSYKAGKEIITYFTQAAQFNATPQYYTLKLGCTLDKNDQGTFYVFNIDRSKPKAINKDFKKDVDYWANLVRTTTLRVDETSETTEETTSNDLF